MEQSIDKAEELNKIMADSLFQLKKLIGEDSTTGWHYEFG